MNSTAIRRRAARLGYDLQPRQRDCFGRLHPWRTSPNASGGPTNYFPSLPAVARYLGQVEQIRSWQQP